MHERAKESLIRLFELFAEDEAACSKASERDLPETVARVTVIKRQNRGLPCEHRSMGNNIIMVLNGTNDARTFNQWKEAGRYPKKGAKAFHIFKPYTRKVKEKAQDREEEERLAVYGFGSLPVFRYEDTEGEPVDHPDYSPVKLPPLTEVTAALGIDVRYAPHDGRYLGFYAPGQRFITLMSHDTRIFFHELAHAVDHRASGLEGPPELQEIVAETVAATLGVMYGLEDQTPISRRYIEKLAPGDQQAAKAVLGALARIEKCLDLILDAERPPEVLALAASEGRLEG